MSSIKCSNCGLINFVTTQYCKRCNSPVIQGQNNNQTQIIGNNNTSFRPTPPPANQPPNYYQNTPNSSQNNYGYANQSAPPAYQPHNEFTLPRYNDEQERANYYRQQQPPLQQNYYQNQNPMGYQPEPMLRRFGNEIALHKNGSLPLSCVKCGKRISSVLEGEYVSQKFRWHNPLVYIALLSPIIYLIIALCVSHSFTVNVPLCNEHLKSRENTKHFLLGSGLGLFILMVLSGILGYPALIFLLLIVGILGLTITYEIGFKTLSVKGVEGNYYHLKGASEQYLSNIPY